MLHFNSKKSFHLKTWIWTNLALKGSFPLGKFSWLKRQPQRQWLFLPWLLGMLGQKLGSFVHWQSVMAKITIWQW